MKNLVPTDAEALIEQLMTLHPKGYDLSLGRISGLLDRLGNPQDRLPPVLHVAGTNGKGSFTAFARALLEAEGHLVHVHTSPHLVRWHERFRLGEEGGGKFVEDAVLTDAIARVAEANAGASITVFEILTAAMFLLFSEHPADAVIIEVGLGGRFDATNVITKPAVSVIMPVSLDHVALLGDNAADIAFEKAGIMKPQCPVVIGQQPFEDALDVLTLRGEELSCPMHIFGQDFAGFEEHGRFVYQDEDGLLDLPMPHLIGQHQIANASAAIKAVRDAGFAFRQETAERAMIHVTWPGRFQPLPKGALIEENFGFRGGHLPQIYVDGGHNADAAQATINIINQMEKSDPRPLYLISGMLNTKLPNDFFVPFKGHVEKVMTVPLHSSDAGIEAEALAQLIRDVGIEAQPCTDLKVALRQIAENHHLHANETSPRILICGSLYLAGDALQQNDTLPE